MNMRAASRAAAGAAVLGGVLVAVVGVAGPASAATVRAAAVQPHTGHYQVWATNVNIRESTWDPTTCALGPSVAHCPDIQGQAQPGDDLYVACQRIGGQVVGGNPYWVNVEDLNNGATGWMASFYINYPDNRLPDVPDCA